MDSEIILNAVGDIWFGDHPVVFGHGVNSIAKKYGAQFLFEKIENFISNADINFCNLESVLSEKGLIKWYLPSIEMRGFPDCVLALKTAKFNIVNIANNHIMQHGLDAYIETLNILKKHNIHYIGAEKNNKANLVHFKKENIKLTFVGFSMHPEIYYKGNVLYAYRSSEDNILKDIENIKKDSYNELLILSLHWGNEFMSFPSKKQVDFAHALIDTGVSVILGHHSHVLQEIEEYHNGLIAYSLGNFIFDLWDEKTKQTGILKIALNDKGIKNYDLIPVIINNYYQPAIVIGTKENKKYEKLISHNLLIDKHFSTDDDKYNFLVNKASNRFRLSSYKYFLLNVYKYPIHIILQSVTRTIFNKILKQIKQFGGMKIAL